MSVKICVVGVGKIFQTFHLPALQNQDGVEIKYVVDRNEQLVSKIASQINAIPLTDASKIEGCDLCFVATPPSVRMDVFNAIKDKGMDIVFEKPLSFDEETASEIIREAASRNIRIYVTQTRRFFPNLSLTRRFLQEKVFGNPVEINIFEGGIFSWVTESNYMNKNNTRDMGVVHDIGSHVYDYLLMIMKDSGYKPEQIQLLESKVDFEYLSNNISSKFITSDQKVKINISLSRNILLMNKMVIKFENGTVLSTDSGYGKQVIINKGAFSYHYDITDPDIAAPQFEIVFDKLWENVIHKFKTGNDITGIFNIDVDTVFPSVKFLDQVIQKRTVHSFEKYFSQYGNIEE
jgi:predicted dehydrogenase